MKTTTKQGFEYSKRLLYLSKHLKLEQMNYTKRCLNVVNSCVTRNQLRSAINYCILAKCYNVAEIRQAIEFKVLTLNS